MTNRDSNTAASSQRKRIRKLGEQNLADKEAKKNAKLYYTMQSLLGCHGYRWFWMIGLRGRGKSFALMDTILSYVKRYGQENVKVYYFRISDLSIKLMLLNKGLKLIDALLVRKYHLNLSVHGYSLYNNDKPFIDFYPLVSAAKKGKGILEYDPEFLNKRPKGVKRFIFMLVDEFQLDETQEKKSVGDPVSQFKIYFENILRDQELLDYDAVRILGCLNSVSECSGFLTQLAGFIPEKPGRYYLTRKHMIVDNIPNSTLYLDKRKKSIGLDIMDYDNDVNYTNVVTRDLQSLKPKDVPLRKLTAIVKFTKNPQDWFTVWDGNVIKKYTGQQINDIIAMKRHLDECYNPEVVINLFELYDSRLLIYNDLISQAEFGLRMKELRAR